MKSIKISPPLRAALLIGGAIVGMALLCGFCNLLSYAFGLNREICRAELGDQTYYQYKYIRINYSGFNIDSRPSNPTEFGDDGWNWEYIDTSFLTRVVREEMGFDRAIDTPNQEYCDRLVKELHDLHAPVYNGGYR
jgi:hypothetical protein